ncbi:unnamed protein product [Pieris macdunnoughi]|uniref:Uncharacterized protein n=1 Tax=Pieris macdunnoughi TaxID=345717 RepID=A0A821SBW7_9NEOP|nr:unnamed protein product [Pieris macdunnoughi]
MPYSMPIKKNKSSLIQNPEAKIKGYSTTGYFTLNAAAELNRIKPQGVDLAAVAVEDAAALAAHASLYTRAVRRFVKAV